MAAREAGGPVIPISVKTYNKSSRFPHTNLQNSVPVDFCIRTATGMQGATLLSSETPQDREMEYLFIAFPVFLAETSGPLCEREHSIFWTAILKALNNSHYFMRKKKNPGGIWRHLAQDLKCISALYIFSYFVPLGLFCVECFTHF